MTSVTFLFDFRSTQSYDNALEFLGDNDYEWDLKSVKPSDVTFDGCQVRIIFSFFLR